MFENQDVTELPPQDSPVSASKTFSGLSKMLGTLASSAAVAGGLFVGNLLITTNVTDASSSDSLVNDQAQAEQVTSAEPNQASVAAQPAPSSTSGSFISKLRTPSFSSKTLVSGSASKVDLGTVSFSNSTSATTSSGSGSYSGNSTNTTQAGGSGSGAGNSTNTTQAGGSGSGGRGESEGGRGESEGESEGRDR